MRCEGCRRRRTLTLVLIAIWTAPFESVSAPLLLSGSEPEPLAPGAMLWGSTCRGLGPSAGRGGVPTGVGKDSQRGVTRGR